MRLRSLDGWRGLGAIAVALAHLETSGFADLGGWLPRVSCGWHRGLRAPGRRAVSPACCACRSIRSISARA